MRSRGLDCYDFQYALSRALISIDIWLGKSCLPCSLELWPFAAQWLEGVSSQPCPTSLGFAFCTACDNEMVSGRDLVLLCFPLYSPYVGTVVWGWIPPSCLDDSRELRVADHKNPLGVMLCGWPRDSRVSKQYHLWMFNFVRIILGSTPWCLPSCLVLYVTEGQISVILVFFRTGFMCCVISVSLKYTSAITSHFSKSLNLP